LKIIQSKEEKSLSSSYTNSLMTDSELESVGSYKLKKQDIEKDNNSYIEKLVKKYKKMSTWDKLSGQNKVKIGVAEQDSVS